MGVADPSVRLRKPQTAAVSVQIGPGASTRTVSAVPITIANAPAGMRVRSVDAATVTVEVKGTQAAIEALTPDGLQARVDAANLGPGDHRVDVQVRARSGLSVVSVEPSEARLRITKP